MWTIIIGTLTFHVKADNVRYIPMPKGISIDHGKGGKECFYIPLTAETAEVTIVAPPETMGLVEYPPPLTLKEFEAIFGLSMEAAA